MMNNIPRLKTYLNLCAEYYDLDKPEAPSGALQFYLKYADEAADLILEPMCGTGQFLVPLLERGFQIEGFDASPFMLDRLHKKCVAKNIKPTVWEGRVETIDQHDKYKLIFIASASIGLITDLTVLKNCLKKIYTALRQEGKFVFDVQTLHAVPEQLNVWKGSARRCIDGKKIVLSTLDLPLQDNIGTTICRYDLIEENDIVKTEIEDLRIRLHDTDELSSLLKDIGFKNNKLIKLFNHDEVPLKHDEIVMYECQK